MKLEPKICGLWDGVSVWLQWNAIGGPFRVRMRYRKSEKENWGSWVSVVPRQGKNSSWGVIPTWKEGWQAQAEVALEGGDAWERAIEINFKKSRAFFEFSSEKYDQFFEKGTVFRSVVDIAECSYVLQNDLHLKAGSPAREMMIAAAVTGYCQLDQEDHFIIRPTFGVIIRNVTPSEEDIEDIGGRDFTVIDPRDPQPMGLAILGKAR